MRRITTTLAALLLAPLAWPCTTVCLRSGSAVLVGKNYDWDIGDGLLIVNKRGVAKTSMAATNPAHWVSRYGSVTFNQYGREFPSGGMNEAGLVVELMWLEATRYPTDPALPGLGCLDWIQYQLDTAASVDEVAANAAALRIQSGARLHYLACDAGGRCATLEYLDGRLVAHTGRDLPVPALTNHTYDESLAHAGQFLGFGGTRALPAGSGSLERFARAADGARRFASRSEQQDARSAFELMGSVSQGAFTQWTIVYDLGARQLSFVTQARRSVRSLSLASLDFACTSPVLALDVQADLRGDLASALVPYTLELGLQLLQRAYAGTPFLQGTPAEELLAMARHPEQMTCRR